MNKRRLNKIISLVVMGAFLMQMNPGLQAQSEEECVSQFRLAKSRYLNGQYVNAKTRIERVIAIVIEKKIDRNDILGKCYLLLGAIYEKEDLPLLAEENYRKAKETYGIMKVEDVELTPLPLYRKIVMGEGLTPPGTIESEGKKKKKKFPWLLVAGGVVVVGVLTYFLLRKPKKKTLTIELGEGVEGTPAEGTYTYKKGEVVVYDYRARSGYTQLQVSLDNQPAAAAGQVTMDRNHRLSATAAANVVTIITDTNRVDVPEGGTAAFNVKLSAQPPQEINVTVGRTDGDSDISVMAGGNLTFTPTNWSTNQQVLLQAAEDADADNGSATIALSAPGIAAKNLNAVEMDNDNLQFVTTVDNSISIREGNTETFKVKLSALPTAAITATVERIGGDTDITVISGSPLIFDTGNWNMYQTVTLGAGQDVDTANGEAVIRISGTGVAAKDLTVEEIDDDTLQFDIKADDLPLLIDEGGTKDFQVRLTGQPLNNVIATVSRVSGDSDITVQSGSSLTFTPGTWDVYQTVTLAAAQDDDIQAGTAVIRISAPGLANRDIEAKERDDDTLHFVTDVTEVTVSEGSTAGIQVRLSAAPGPDVYASVSRLSGDTDIIVQSGTTLNFNTTNWQTYQTVTLFAARDEDAANGEAVIKIEATGLSSTTITAREEDTGTGNKPEVSIKNPKDHEGVSGDVPIELVVNDDFGIQKVEFYIDSVLEYTDTVYPYSYTWSTKTANTGPHQIKVIAYDAIDQTDSDEISVTVEDDPPTVEIQTPTHGATVSGMIQVTVKATDYKGVKQILLFLEEDQELGTWQGEPQSEVIRTFDFDTTAYSNGSYVLKAVALDTADQDSQPYGIAITIQN